MARIIKYFKDAEEYNAYLNGKALPADVLPVILSDGGDNVDEMAISTNNLTGEFQTFTVADEYPTPTGTINITENAEGIDVKQYAAANVAVPQPSGNISITANGEGVDIAQDATANVNVPSPDVPIYSFAYSGNNTNSIVPVGDGVQGMPSGADYVVGVSYTHVVTASADVAANLDQLYLEVNAETPTNFSGATVITKTVGGKTVATITKTFTLSGSGDTVKLNYKGVDYVVMIAA